MSGLAASVTAITVVYGAGSVLLAAAGRWLSPARRKHVLLRDEIAIAAAVYIVIMLSFVSGWAKSRGWL